MERTLEEQREILNIQYVLECLIEYYDVAKKESDKYYIKGQLLDFINETEINVEKIRKYMLLQPEKFEPFLNTISCIRHNTMKKKSDHMFNPESVEIRTYICKK